MAQQKESTLGIRCTSLQRRNLEREVVRRWLDSLGNDVATGLEPDEPLDYDGWLRIIERQARQGDSTALARLAEIRGWNRQGGQDPARWLLPRPGARLLHAPLQAPDPLARGQHG